ncbi:type A von Willebrand factor domain-containing protein [Tieghemostelium lacteum]|uniref:Type A von Willebrand factor domain-containing protein n=1 Tax=Tieghemostelium lacteum TaxID=361077 RepID=A0A151ZDY0_TIELA|nr:type A von Willebrand factor domain-containing protein [Tieghemostelium lacteum]|eukprot:KYQ92135.1 type A von Willebrand factor domain-containing protein [Tieghemostelium lacteum]
MRNGDFTPSRYDAQKDAVNLVCSAKTQSNPESCIALMSMAGKTPEVLVTLTQDLSKVLSTCQDAKIYGKTDFSTSMQIAQLALRHRQNKHQHPRIIAFIGSPLSETKEELSALGKRLKKNGVAVDIINFGEISENSEKLDIFLNDVNNNDESHLLTVPSGPHVLSDIILQSPIIGEGNSGNVYGSEFINPDTDPDLAMALKLSLEEEKQRQEREKKSREDQSGGSTQTSGTTTTTTTANNNDINFEDDPELAEALALSMQTDKMDTSTTTTNNTSSTTNDTAFGDQDFINSTLSSLPGVDPSRIKNALESLQKKDDDKKDDQNKEQK